MKTLYLSVFILLAISASAQPQTDRIDTSLPCYDTKALFKVLTEKYQESPMIMGKAEDAAKSTMTLWVHPIHNSWTIVATKKELSCVVGSGSDIKILSKKNSKSI